MTANIHIPTFDADIVLMADVGRAHLARYIKKNFGCEIDRMDEQAYSGITFDVGNLTWVVYIPDTSMGDFIWLVKTLSHEANHVVLQMMRNLGIQDDETICYSQDNLLGELLGKILKKKKNRKPRN